jgi:hypothetical protein
MKEANGGISGGHVSLAINFRILEKYLRAGSLPKKATKVTKEIESVNMVMSRMRAISGAVTVL